MKQKNIINASPLATPYGFIVAEPRKNGFSLCLSGKELIRLKIKDDKAEIQFRHNSNCWETIKESINKLGKVVAFVDENQAFIEIDGHRIVTVEYKTVLFVTIESRKQHLPNGSWTNCVYNPGRGFYYIGKSYIHCA